MNSRIVAIDIGNTTITCGLFSARRLMRSFAHPTALCGRFPVPSLRSDDVIIASVVPQALDCLVKSFVRTTGRKPLVVGPDIVVPITNRYSRPRQVGADRLVNAYAAIRLYTAPAVIVDFGTAVTFDAVSSKKEYLGGMIFPGLQMSLDALHEKTALLPQTALRRPAMFIGRTTAESIASGITYGFAAMTEALVSRIKKSLGRRAPVIATGGNALFIAAYCGVFDAVEPHLTLKGLQLIHEHYAKKSRLR
jgi:type III pantothenate kinase